MLYALIAVAVLVVLVAVLLHVSVNVRFRYDSGEDVFHCTVHYLFIDHVISPPQKSKRKKKKDKPKKISEKKASSGKEEQSPLKNLYKEKGLIGFLDSMKAVFKSIWHILVGVLRRSVLKKFDIKMNIVGEDAADTAIKYGYANSVVYPIAGAILENVEKYDDYNIELTPNFTEGADSSVTFDAIIGIRPSKFLSVLIKNHKEIRTLLSAFSNNTNNSKENKK